MATPILSHCAPAQNIFYPILPDRISPHKALLAFARRPFFHRKPLNDHDLLWIWEIVDCDIVSGFFIVKGGVD